MPDIDEPGAYCKDNLKGEDAATLWGFEWAIKSVNTCIDNIEFDLDDGRLVSRLRIELIEYVRQELLSWLHSDRAELVVSLIEHGDYPDEDGDGE